MKPISRSCTWSCPVCNRPTKLNRSRKADEWRAVCRHCRMKFNYRTQRTKQSITVAENWGLINQEILLGLQVPRRGGRDSA